MTGRERFLTACNCGALDRPPIWMMRQAGRYLPEYQEIKRSHSFHEMVRTPELSAEVTLQPMRRFGFDAAIIFSDILVVPEAMGQGFSFGEGRGGVHMDFPVRTRADLQRLSVDGAAARLDYVYAALRRTRGVLGAESALLGFGGSPWTLACYMIEGGSSGDGATVRAMAARRDPVLTDLLALLTSVLVQYFRNQISAGTDAIQIFDSCAPWCADYEEHSLRWVREIVRDLPEGFPVIFFARGRNSEASPLASTGARVLSLDWETPLSDVRRALGRDIALQGNLDPEFLEGDPSAAANAAQAVLADMALWRGHIFNLGHGIRPAARVESVAAVVETVQAFKHEDYAVAAG
jgi:uroporphyrinogen decarboxylase